MRQRHLEKDFEHIKTYLSEMMEDVRKQILDSINALEHINYEKAVKIIKDDDLIDDFQRKIENETFAYIGRYHPLAEDLRYVIMVIKIATDLERIADLAVNISKVVKKHKGEQLPKPLVHIKKMSGYVIKMLDDVLNAYYATDLSVTKKICYDDEEIDKIYKFIKEEISVKIIECDDISDVKFFIDLLLVARFLERVGDHIVNIAEELYYMEMGENLHEVIEIEKKLSKE